mmetsp:Transcript_84464/g.225698  ORF Transcript_84464/g.225698 Transcript_84464/m.225698 type:complete len:206 (-) Transcript_84464:452-1069(-)
MLFLRAQQRLRVTHTPHPICRCHINFSGGRPRNGKILECTSVCVEVSERGSQHTLQLADFFRCSRIICSVTLRLQAGLPQLVQSRSRLPRDDVPSATTHTSDAATPCISGTKAAQPCGSKLRVGLVARQGRIRSLRRTFRRHAVRHCRRGRNRTLLIPSFDILPPHQAVTSLFQTRHDVLHANPDRSSQSETRIQQLANDDGGVH